MKFAFITHFDGPITSRGKWPSNNNCIEAWCYLMNADHFSGTYGDEKTWDTLRKYDVIMVNQNTTMFSLTCQVKKNCPNAFLIAVAEGSVCDIGRFDNKTLNLMVQAARACDVYGVLVDWSVSYYSLITSRPVRWIGVPFYPEFFKPYKIDPAKKDSSSPIIGLQNPLGGGRNGVISLLIASRLRNSRILLPGTEPGHEDLIKTLGLKNINGAPYLDWKQYAERYSQAYIGIHLDTLYTWGRFPLDMAALGIPVIGSNRNQTNNILWPELTVDPIQETGVAVLVAQRLLKDRTYYLAQINRAYKALENFTAVSTKRRLLDIIRDVKKDR